MRRLEAMGLRTYVRRSLAAPKGKTPAASAPDQPIAAEAKRRDSFWAQLEGEVKDCVSCALHQRRTQTVFGVGAKNAEWMLIGEGPGVEEDRQGEPFVGRAGKLLDRMLSAIGLDREQAYIANVVKCRPPDNRNPRPEEIGACNGYLQRQMELVRPQIILCLGGVAANAMLDGSASVGQLRGRVHRYGERGVPLVVTYHPAYLLRAPGRKRAAWDDLQLACREMGRTIPV